MQSFDIEYAQEHFDELVALVDAGEYVEITHPNGKAIVMLTELEYLQLRTAGQSERDSLSNLG